MEFLEEAWIIKEDDMLYGGCDEYDEKRKNEELLFAQKQLGIYVNHPAWWSTCFLFSSHHDIILDIF